MSLQSIHKIVPKDFSGRDAREGFDYQDHVGVYLCLKMLLDPRISEVWFETEDDLTVIWNEGGEETVEFIQVKNTQPTSRWSIANICYKNTDDSDSLLETSLYLDRCSETTRFRIVTSFGVNQDLITLTYPLGEKFRLEAKTKEEDLIKQIKKKTGDIKSPKGNGVDYWVKNCWWEKLPDSMNALQALNIQDHLLALTQSLGLILFPDQQQELYRQFLGKVKSAASVDIKQNAQASKFQRKELLKWFSDITTSFNQPKGATTKLEKKLLEAGFDEIIIDNAKELKLLYKSARLDVDYLKGSEYDQLEEIISDKLNDALIDFDAGSIDSSPPKFLQFCKDLLENVLTEKGFDIPKNHAKGFMFDRTNRCLHRFNKVG